MQRAITLFILAALFCSTSLYAQKITLNKAALEPVNVSLSMEKVMGKKAVKAIKDSSIKEVDEPTFIKIKGLDFTNGTIEVKVLSRLLPDAPDFARGFIGIAFRINDSNTKYENIYIRPANARVDDQVRRNHSIPFNTILIPTINLVVCEKKHRKNTRRTLIWR